MVLVDQPYSDNATYPLVLAFRVDFLNFYSCGQEIWPYRNTVGCIPDCSESREAVEPTLVVVCSGAE